MIVYPNMILAQVNMLISENIFLKRDFHNSFDQFPWNHSAILAIKISPPTSEKRSCCPTHIAELRIIPTTIIFQSTLHHRHFVRFNVEISQLGFAELAMIYAGNPVLQATIAQ